MKHSFTRRVALTLGAALVAGAAAPAIAQNYPDKPVRLVVNFPPGGAADRIARLVAQPLQDALGQTIIVENKGGANGNIGGDYVAKAASDGYTLLMSSGSMVSVNPHLYSSMSYDPLKDLTPVAAVAKVMLYLVAREDKMPSDLQGFLKKIKDNPGKLSYASPGNGSSPHLGMALLEQATGVRGIHVPYRGAGPALQDLLAGQVDYAFDPGVALPHVKAGKLNLIAVGSMERAAEFPNTPTLDELGVKGFEADTVFGIYAPAGTPQEIVTKLNTEITKIVRSDNFKSQLAVMGGAPAPMTPDEFDQVAKRDSERFGAVIRAQNIKVD